MQNIRKMLLVLVLAMALILTAACQLPSQNNDFDQKAIKTTIQRTDAQLLSGFNGTEANTNNLKESDTVDVIIEVEGNSLTENYLKQSEFSTLKDYALSSKGLEAVEQMNETQAIVKTAIENLHIDAQFDKTYTTLLNGFSATIKYGNITAIEALDFVERVIVSEVYATPNTTYNDIASLMDSFGIYNKTEYTGKGILVAIVDTGVDFYHDAFSNDPAVETFKKEDLEEVLPILHGASSGASYFETSELYYNAKVPFQFDYADNDTWAIPSPFTIDEGGGYHGTHVAGIAVGNGGQIVGAAPDAQLFNMKVFTDGWDSSCKLSDVISALGDCAILGVDVINLSLGTPAGFTSERDYDSQYINEMYALMERLGITMCVAAGNSYSQSEINVNGAADPSNPDIGVLGSPSSYDVSFSVASVNAYEKNWFTATNDSYQYRFWPAKDENGAYHEFTSLFITEGEAKELEVVMIPNYGEEADYEGLDVTGKVAIVQRGGISFTEKSTIAAEHGAAVCLIYNDVANTALGAVVNDLKIPTATILMEDGLKLAILSTEAPVTLVFNINNKVINMSDFSSWGTLSDLTLKPEITAPGGNIYSSMPTTYWEGEYGYLSGTSMAAPNLTGLMASLREYVKTEYPYLTNIEIRDLCYQLVMSTALKAVDDNQVVVSPRKQGAGIADINAAINTKAYLSVTGSNRTKLELGDDKNRDCVYTLKFNLVNFGEEALSYDVDAIVMTESVVDGLIAMSGHVFTDREIKLSVKNGTLDGNIITVEAGETAAIKMVITLTDEEKAYLDETFVNGYYVEGFATLTAVEENSEDLSIPFLAFYGDWTDASIFDVPVTEGNPYIYSLSLVGSYRYNAYIMGSYQWNLPEGYKQPEASTQKIAISQQNDANNAIYAVNLSLLRNVSELHYYLKDKVTGYVYASFYGYNIGKNYYNNGSLIVAQHAINIDAREYDFLNNQELEFVITAELDYEGRNQFQSFTFPVIVDSESPTLVDCELREENGRTYLDMDIFDNSSLMYYTFYSQKDGQLTIIDDVVYPVYQFTRNQNNCYTHDVTDILSKLNGGQLVVQIADGAYNTGAYVIDFDGEEGNSENSSSEATSFISDESYITSEIVMPEANDSLIINEATDDEHNFVVVNGTLVSYKGPGGEIVIPDGVTEIADKVFYFNKTITKITIPEGCTKIGASAFENCAKVTEIVFPTETEMTFGTKTFASMLSLEAANISEAKIVSFGTYAFTGSQLTELTVNPVEGKTVTLGDTFMAASTSLKKVTINADIGEIRSAFDLCLALEEVYFNGKVGNFVKTGFLACEELSVLEFHDDVGNIGTNDNYVVTLCYNKLKKVEFFGNVKGITGIAFSYCQDLEEVIFHGNLEQYRHDLAFGYSTKLKKFTVAEDNEYLVEDTETGVVYNKDKTKMYTPSSWEYDGIFELPETITSLDSGHFSHTEHRFSVANYKKNIVIHENGVGWSTSYAREIYKEARYAIKGVKLHSKITALSKYCFNDNHNLVSVEGMENVSNMNFNQIFGNCASLEKFDFTATNVSVIGANTFTNCTSLKEVILPTGLTAIPNYMFNNCTALETISIPENVTRINTCAFDSCTSLKNIKLSSKLTTLGMYAFSDCTALEAIELPEKMTYVDWYCFKNCTALKEINLDNVTTIGKAAFYNCSSLVSVNIGPVKSISDEAFRYCTVLENVSFANGVQKIGSYSFANTAIREVVLPESILSFNFATSFTECPKLEKFVISENASQWSSVDGVLYTKATDKLLLYPVAKPDTELTLPETVTTITENAFYQNKTLLKMTAVNLETIEANVFYEAAITELNATPLYIGASAFAYSDITAINLEKALEIDSYAFYSTKNISSLTFESPVEIGTKAFAMSSALNEVILHNFEYIGSRAFENSSVSFVTIGNVDYFDYTFAFAGCNIEKVELLDECTSFVMENGMLMNGEKTVILDYFGNSSNIEIEEGVVKIAAYAFINTENLKTLVLPSTLRVISDKAFYGCEKLTEITFNSQEAPILECAYDADRAYGYANFVCYMEDIAESMVEITINHPEHASYNNFIYATYFAKNR